MLRTLTLALALILTAPAQAAYSALYVFGDSLSDNGNAYALSGATWPPSPPYAQQFSDGPTAAEYLADGLGIALAPSIADGSNYAVGGAMTGLTNYNHLVASPFPLPASLASTGLLAQVGGFAASPPSFDPARSLFMLWAAPNDFFYALSTGGNVLAAASAAVTNLITSVGLLARLGATDFLIPNMPNLAQTPFGLAQQDALRAGLDALSAGFNTALAGALDLARGGGIPGIGTGLDLMSFDTAAFLDEVITSPAAYGFTNVTDACVLTAWPACDGYLFFDSVHPTTAAHRLLGERFLATVPEPDMAALLALGLLALLALRRRPGAD
ncbi:SGNH/GDSL hydrolase family protein [Thauera sp.]|uniref:SGNH/GDSL hydrolase family protein n=1 Tax=Thauera sp. TaxID=1905334 RepID=UPI002D165205|nr:SGNH/GDSL hydrolase family protein [Thauera sp.]HRP25793.1 SGNH/GDSL hydrolase family protein [Thauera sp.]